MSQANTQPLSPQKFLLLAANLLHRALVEATRTDAKQLYRRIEEGERAALANVRMEDDSTAAFGLSLDHSEFRGKLNYGAFRASLNTLLANVGQALQEEKAIQVFNAQDGGASMIFGIPAVTVEQGKTNVLVLSADPGASGGTELRLMYLDPQQFEQQFAAPEEGAGGTVA
ncbi:MAG: hypothetical protein HKN19_16140 [Halioglobus sp.]|nr:hypothetical protein [Halioglobus sp.]